MNRGVCPIAGSIPARSTGFGFVVLIRRSAMRRDKRNRRGLADLVVFFAIFGAFVFGGGVGIWVDQNVGNPFEEAAEWIAGDVTPPKVE
jgi:hypothetical protein